MEFEVSYNLENEDQFWAELDDIVAADCRENHELIDNALRAYLSFTTNFKAEYLQTEYDVARCSIKLLQSSLFTNNKEYVRRQIIYGLLQEDDISSLHIIAAFMLFDGRHHEEAFEMMQTEAAFPRLVDLIPKCTSGEDGPLQRLMLELIYEMSRIQRLSWDDLMAVDDTFVLYLFQTIEQFSDDVNDPYHYPIIRVLLVLNEQYMLASTDPNPPRGLTNRVIKALSTHGNVYKTFGENLILLLNRESETSLQLLILKLLYLLFQSPTTAEYFYTNDLHVLVDVILRNLLDLPSDSAPAAALRHTYLRVLHPLLANSQIKRPPYYKRQEVLKLLSLLTNMNSAGSMHFAPVDSTTVRLVHRCTSVPWLEEELGKAADPALSREDSETGSDRSPDTPTGDGVKDAQKELARRMLGMHVKDAGESSLSVIAVAAHQEKPGVLTPSRERSASNPDNDGA